MAAMGPIILCLLVIIRDFRSSSASTHWIVTEDGMIQQQADSVYNLRRPYDLVSLMKQEERAIVVENLKQELIQKKAEIDRNEDKDPGLETKFYQNDADCMAAGKPLPDFDLYISTVLPLENKGIRPEEHIDMKAPVATNPMVPDCTAATPLDFSIHAFEHLEGVQERVNLSGSPELGLRNAITHRENVDDYGHLVYEALQRNATSWVLYNMAAFYWRIKGEPHHVLECLRRALHHSPRMQKDVALISLANVLHRTRYSNEAAIVVHAALDVSKELNVNHFTLGNIYAVLAEYNKSVICFENTLKIQPDFEAAAKRKHAVLCHAKLESALEAQHRTLQRTLDELRDYQNKHEYWQRQQDKLIFDQALPDVKIVQEESYNMWKAREKTHTGEHCQVEDGENGENYLNCKNKASIINDFDFLNSWSTEKKTGKSATFEDPTYIDYMKPVRSALYEERHPEIPEAMQNLPYLLKDWPPSDECDTFVHKFPNWNEYPTTYLAPENKGFEVKALLAEAQGLERGTEHPLPWYPPVCVTQADIPEGGRSYDHIQSVKERTKIPLRIQDSTMKQVLLDMVDGKDITEEEVGQRLLTALKKKIGPSWLLYNLGALYWRVNGNNYHAIECIRRALYFAPDQYKDVPLVNLANILYKLGRVDDAVTVMRDAVMVNDLEPETHFFLGNMLAAKLNLTGAIHYFQEALAQNPTHKQAFTALRTIMCYQKFHRPAQSAAPKEVPKPETSTSECQKDKSDARKGLPLCKHDARKPEMSCGTCKPKKHCVRVEENTNTNTNNECGGKGGGGEQRIQEQCLHAIPADQVSDTLGTGVLDPARLDEISEYYRQNGVCKGEECHRFLVQTAHHHKPHIRLEIIDDVLEQKFLFIEPNTELQVGADECVIFNNGVKSHGCSKPEFQTYDLDKFSKFVSTPLAFEHFPDASFVEGGHVKKMHPKVPKKKTDSDDDPDDDEDAEDEDEDEYEDDPLSALDSPDSLAEFSRDPTRYIGVSYQLAWPTWDECRETYKKIDWKRFLSTWVSVSTKNIDVRDHIDFDHVLVNEPMKTPECDVSNDEGSVLDTLESVKDVGSLAYDSEFGLEEHLQKISGELESTDVVGARIARALQHNQTSWVLANLAALYWRVEGDSFQAVNCIKLAYNYSPKDSRDIALLSLANILHQSGRLDDASVATTMALDIAPDLVAIHFTMANLFAAKGEWLKATQFYEATLGLQQEFTPAAERLRHIQCDKVLSNPHIYKNKAKNNT